MNRQQSLEKIITALTVTAEVMQQQLSPQALVVMAEDLVVYGTAPVETALSRVRKECKRFTVADVIERIDDGRPGVEEAWAMIPRDESQTVVWTTEAAEAYGVCSPLLAAGDKIGARQAFKEKYSALVSKARTEAVPVQWSASLGSDQACREEALKLAVESGKLSADNARMLLPNSSYRITKGGQRLLNGAMHAIALLQSDSKPDYANNSEQAAKLIEEIWGKPKEYKPTKKTYLLAVGTISDCGSARFIGGDPADPKAWEKIADVKTQKKGAA